MDACFLSSSSFTKTIEVLPAIKGGFLTSSRQNSIQYQSKRFKVPLSVSCSQSNSTSASVQDERGPLLNSDWRAFRARLVASERTSTPKKPALMVDPYNSMDHPHPSEDKWAHTIREPEKGCLLIATEKLDGDHIYKRTVILVLSTGTTGITGLILNRPSFFSMKEMRSWALNISGPLSDKPLFFGGPLEEGLFLVNTKQGKNEVKKSGLFDEVMNGLYYGTRESISCATEMKRDSAEIGDFRFFDGYCAWERDELREEISAGYWTVAACNPNVIGLNSIVSSIGLWDEINELMGHKKVC